MEKKPENKKSNGKFVVKQQSFQYNMTFGCVCVCAKLKREVPK